MSTTTVIALYAGILSTAALTLQLVSEWRNWNTRLVVKLHRMQIVGPGRSEPAVVFEIVNHSGHMVKVTHVGMEPLRKGGLSLFFPNPLPLGVPGPFEVPPRDAITLYQPPDSLGDGDPDYKTRARISTSDTKTFKSKRVRVRDLLEG